mmetsp:Transcript_46605/g.122367  ORF Transcript_46605/g.122367 Transcript_46605/m.122367 type:complete len:176 (-) Transcript_46605:372-899(-)
MPCAAHGVPHGSLPRLWQALLEVHDRIATQPSRRIPGQVAASLPLDTAADVLSGWIQSASEQLTTSIYVDEDQTPRRDALLLAPASPARTSLASRLQRVRWPSARHRWRVARADAYWHLSRLAVWPMRRVRPLLLMAILVAAQTTGVTQRLGWQAREALRERLRPQRTLPVGKAG